MQVGSAHLAKSATTYAVCLAFAVTFLIATALGAGLVTATIRGVVVAVLVRLVGPVLLRTVLSTVLDAMARDRLGGSREDETR